MNNECIFCKIISGSINSHILSENDKSLCLLDAFPLTKGHCLIIPKKHFLKFQDMTYDYVCSVFDLLYKIIQPLEKAMKVDATIIAIHNGKDAGQEIPHVHVHVVPRNKNDNAGPIHSMFKTRPQLSDIELLDIYKKIKLLL